MTVGNAVLAPLRRFVAFTLICLTGLTLPGARLNAQKGAVSSAPVTTVTIDTRTTYQTLEGFGAATAYYQNWVARHPNKTALYDAFFKGLNLSILRLQNVYRPEKGADFAPDDAAIVRGASASLGHPIRILMTSWSPPGALKSTGDEKHGGTLAKENGAFVYGKFADYWVDSLAAYRKIGIAPDWVSIQNEPDWKADWESCLFQPHETTDDKGVSFAGYDKALNAVYHRFQTVPHAPALLGPETLGIGYHSVENYLGPSNSPVVQELDGIAHHLYSGGDHQAPDSFLPTLRALRDEYPNKSKWMTEFGRSDGFQTAWVIHNCLTEENAVAYVYWAGIWPGKDSLIDVDNYETPKDRWKYPQGFGFNDRYYGLKHFSYFLTPGYKRISVGNTPSDLKVSAFLSPDRSRLVVVALNTATTNPETLRLSLAGFAFRGSQMYRSVLPPPAVTPTEGEKIGVNGPGERFRALGALPSNRQVMLPPHAIVTIAFTAAPKGRP